MNLLTDRAASPAVGVAVARRRFTAVDRVAVAIAIPAVHCGEHVPLIQGFEPLIAAHATPQVPQLFTSMLVMVSQPSSSEPACGPLQSA